jgi:hypothetical protein
MDIVQPSPAICHSLGHSLGIPILGNAEEVITTGDRGPNVYLEGRAYLWRQTRPRISHTGCHWVGWHAVVCYGAPERFRAFQLHWYMWWLAFQWLTQQFLVFLLYCDVSIVNLYSVIMRWTSQSSDHGNAATASQPQ